MDVQGWNCREWKDWHSLEVRGSWVAKFVFLHEKVT